MKRKHFLQGVGLAGIAAATPLRALGSGLDPNKAPRGTRILLRNGYVITVVARARRLATESRDYLFQKGSYPLPENLKKGS